MSILSSSSLLTTSGIAHSLLLAVVGCGLTGPIFVPTVVYEARCCTFLPKETFGHFLSWIILLVNALCDVQGR